MLKSCRRVCFAAFLFLTLASARAEIIHRYSFTTNANDSIGTANGTLQGGAVIANGAVVLNGTGAYVNLPAGLISSLQDVTFEAWVTPSAANIWGRVFDFGSSSGGVGGQGTGLTYVFLTTVAGGNGPLRFAYTIDSNGGENPVLNGPAITNDVPYYLAVVYSPSANTSGLFVNGTQVALGTAENPLSSISDVNDWLGKSQWNDPYFAGSIDEFRIWDSALTPGQIVTNFQNGPNNLVQPPPSAPVVANSAATSILTTSAVLNGQILSTGGSTPVVTIYYGAANGGTNAAAWANRAVLGPKTLGFSTPISGLATNTTYYYTASAANAVGTAWASPAATFTTLAGDPVTTHVSMLTFHNDNTRQGANTNETLLTPGNVNATGFGKLFTYTVDGYVYAQPLIVTNLTIPGQGTHNVVVVATEHDSVYAFDADSNSGANGGLLWHTNLGISALSASASFGYRYTGGGYTDMVPEVGATGTPVIDPVSGTIYLDAFTHEGANYIHRIHALNITTGSEQPYSPVVVSASVHGTGVGGSGGVIQFSATQHMQRPALTLVGGMLYVSYGGFADTDPYHGWIMGYNATNLAPVANYVFNTTPNATTAAFGPNAGEGGIWMGGNGLCVDAASNLFFETGNGSFSQNTNGGDYADSFVKLSTSNKLAVADYFTPYNQAALAGGDTDLGSGGPLLLPDSAGSAVHPNLIVGCGKQGTIYVVDRDNMGHFHAGNDSQIVQSVIGANNGVWSSPAYFNHLIFYQASSDVMRSFTISNAVMGTTPASQSAVGYGIFTGSPVISANGTSNAIAWAINSASFGGGGPDILYAYNATNLSQMLYNSSQNQTRDNPGGAVKMTTPTVAGGKVYVGAEYALSVYGVQAFLTAPLISPTGGAFTNSVLVTMTDASPGVSIYYTLDGTTPTVGSALYSGPITLTGGALVQAIAVRPGAVNSAISSASFVNTAAAGDGTGLVGQYYANTFPTNPFTGTPLTRTDASINFNWSTTPPDPSIPDTNFTVRWTGSVQPQFNEQYTFYTTAEDGVRLYLNGALLIDDWVDQPATTRSATVTLVAQQFYNLELDYYHHTSNAMVTLAWSSPSTPQAIIPQMQLYPVANPPPAVALTSPADNSIITAAASVTIAANAAAQYNTLAGVTFYANNSALATLTEPPFTITPTGLGAGTYALIAVATDLTGVSSTSAPVDITVTNRGGQAYGLTSLGTGQPFFNMPDSFNGSLPARLSLTGVFTNTAAMSPAASLVPYTPNVPLWSDGALKVRYLGVPNNGGIRTPDEQITFAPTGTWSFPAGTVFVKTFELLTNESDPASIRRLETRLLVRDTNGAVYGVTYKWRPDNSDADLLSGSLNENIAITTPGGVITQTWYYPSPADCLQCHTPAANYVLGLSARQLNGKQTYSTGVTDNQLRTLNRIGLLNPAIDNDDIPGYEKLSALTNTAASLQERVKSYMDANCAQCHQPGGTGPSFDARYETPLTNQNLIYGLLAKGNLGYDHAYVITPDDTLRSVLYDRMNTTDSAVKMPPLARNLIDTNAVAVFAAWINSLPGTPALPPPTINPDGGAFTGSASITLTPPDANATLYYTLDGTLPTTNSVEYTGPFVLTTTATVNANAFENGFVNSVAANAFFAIQPNLAFNGFTGFTNGVFQLQLQGVAGQSYILQATTNFSTWISISTNTPATVPFYLIDPGASNYPFRFYRAVQE